MVAEAPGAVVHVQADVAGAARPSRPRWSARARRDRARRGLTGAARAWPRAQPSAAAQALALRLLLALLARRRSGCRTGPIYRVAYVVGAGLSLVMPARRASVRAQPRRGSARWLVAQGWPARASRRRRADAARARAPRARRLRPLGGHVRRGRPRAALQRRGAAGAHRARRPGGQPRGARGRGRPASVGVIHMAMHFGSVDLSALYGARVGRAAA